LPDDLLTISIVVHESREDLCALLSGLEPLSADPRFATVVVDNASTDGSADAVRTGFPWVALVTRERRSGFGANHNAALEMARSRYVLLVNDDARIFPDSVRRLVAYAEAHPRAAAVAPAVVGLDGRRQQTAWTRLTPWNAALQAVTLGRLGWVRSNARRPRRVGRASGCVLLLRSAALDRVGGFDERFFMYAEDADLCRRLEDAGYEVRFLPYAVATHRGQGAPRPHAARRLNEQWRSTHLYLAKHHGRLEAAVIREMLALGLALRCGVAAVLERAGLRRSGQAREFRSASSLARRPPAGSGLRELAEEWNVSAAATDRPARALAARAAR